MWCVNKGWTRSDGYERCLEVFFAASGFTCSSSEISHCIMETSTYRTTLLWSGVSTSVTMMLLGFFGPTLS